MPLIFPASVKMDVETDKATGGHAHSSQGAPTSSLSRFQTFLFAVTCALAVANVYFAQPLLESMAASLSVSPGTIGIVVTATQAVMQWGCCPSCRLATCSIGKNSS